MGKFAAHLFDDCNGWVGKSVDGDQNFVLGIILGEKAAQILF
jgi:hypothetical protein